MRGERAFFSDVCKLTNHIARESVCVCVCSCVSRPCLPQWLPVYRLYWATTLRCDDDDIKVVVVYVKTNSRSSHELHSFVCVCMNTLYACVPIDQIHCTHT